jgi:hypothetical protein
LYDEEKKKRFSVLFACSRGTLEREREREREELHK